MKKILIIGARGFGREICDTFNEMEGYAKDFFIKGFLDDKEDALSGFSGYPTIISSVEDYRVEPEDVFFCALGDPFYRKKYVDIILTKGGKFINCISPLAHFRSNVSLGKGIYIGPFCNLSSDTKIGDFSMIQAYCALGHDASIGEFCEIETFSYLGGFSSVSDFSTLHTRSTILPHVTIGEKAVIGAGSVVIKNVKANTTVFGIPAKIIKF